MSRAGLSKRTLPKIETETDPDLVNKKEKSHVLNLDLRAALEHIFLRKNGAAEILDIFHHSVEIQSRPESEQIRSFFMSGEFAPCLVQVNNPAAKAVDQSADAEPVQREVGDYYGIGRQYQLEGIKDSEELCDQINFMGRLYVQARRFDMISLVKMITLKLQVAWNSYPGLSQCGALLEVTNLAFKDVSTGTYDHLQTWIINFVADTIDLFYYGCPERFWEIMHENPALHNAVFQLRKELLHKTPNKYADARVLVHSRGMTGVQGYKGLGKRKAEERES